MKTTDTIILDAIQLVCQFKESSKLHPVLCDELELETNTKGIDKAERQEALQRLEAADTSGEEEQSTDTIMYQQSKTRI